MGKSPRILYRFLLNLWATCHRNGSPSIDSRPTNEGNRRRPWIVDALGTATIAPRTPAEALCQTGCSGVSNSRFAARPTMKPQMPARIAATKRTADCSPTKNRKLSVLSPSGVHRPKVSEKFRSARCHARGEGIRYPFQPNQQRPALHNGRRGALSQYAASSYPFTHLRESSFSSTPSAPDQWTTRPLDPLTFYGFGRQRRLGWRAALVSSMRLTRG